jgi:hypothetical protein
MRPQKLELLPYPYPMIMIGIPDIIVPNTGIKPKIKTINERVRI